MLLLECEGLNAEFGLKTFRLDVKNILENIQRSNTSRSENYLVVHE